MRIAHATLPRRFAPLPTVGRTEHRQPRPSGQRAECPECDKPVIASAIVTDDPSWSNEHHTFVRLRRFWCDHCQHLVTWLQATSADGKTEGPTLVGPAYLRDTARSHTVERFLADHPEAAGVEQS